MADVFISYAREDEPKAWQLAEALTAHGWGCGGLEAFREATAQAVARCVEALP